MKAVDLIRWMRRLHEDHHKRVFFAKEIAALSGESRASAAMTLIRAARKGLVERVGNLWINLIDPPELLEVALAYRPSSYLSFESALYRCGLLSQSPRGGLTLATPTRPQVVKTSLGVIRFIHLKPNLFFGFDERRIALPEKAWLDWLYLRGLRGRGQPITETVYSARLNRRRLKEFAQRFPWWVTPGRSSGMTAAIKEDS